MEHSSIERGMKFEKCATGRSAEDAFSLKVKSLSGDLILPSFLSRDFLGIRSIICSSKNLFALQRSPETFAEKNVFVMHDTRDFSARRIPVRCIS